MVVGSKPQRVVKLARLLVSSLQSQLFNDWLIARMRDGLYARVLPGDLLHKLRRPIDPRRELASDAGTLAGARPTDKTHGGMFTCEDAPTDEARLLAGELVITGPMFGDRMRRPTDDSPAAARELATLESRGLLPDAFATVRSIAEGTRRDATITVGTPEVRTLEPGVLEVAFSLPGGAYATAVMREIMKSS
jgi:tRNA pseudouridine13 synthase